MGQVVVTSTHRWSVPSEMVIVDVLRPWDAVNGKSLICWCFEYVMGLRLLKVVLYSNRDILKNIGKKSIFSKKGDKVSLNIGPNFNNYRHPKVVYPLPIPSITVGVAVGRIFHLKPNQWARTTP